MTNLPDLGDPMEINTPVEEELSNVPAAKLKHIFDQFYFAKKDNCNSEFWQLIQLPENCFGGKLLIWTIEKSEHIVLRHWDKEDFNNLPLCKFILPPTEDQIDEYIPVILETLDYEDDESTKITLKSYLMQPDSKWIDVIPEKDIEDMRKIKNEPNQCEASKMIKKFMETADEKTKLLIRYRALRLEDFISNSLPNFIGYLSQKPDSEHYVQMYRLSLLFEVSDAKDKEKKGHLYIPLLPKIFHVSEEIKSSEKVDSWMPGTAYIKPTDSLNRLEWIPVIRNDISTNKPKFSSARASRENIQYSEKVFCILEEKNKDKLEHEKYNHYPFLDIYFPHSKSEELKIIFDQLCFAKKGDCEADYLHVLYPPENCFGGKPLVISIEKSEHIVLRHWDKDDFNNLPMYKFIGHPTEEKMNEYVHRIIDSMGFMDDFEMKSYIKKNLRSYEKDWMYIIPEKDKEEMWKIRNENNPEEISKMIKNFKREAEKKTKILLRYRAFQKSIPKENFVPRYRHFLSCFVTATSEEEPLVGILTIPIAKNILEINKKTKNGEITKEYCNMARVPDIDNNIDDHMEVDTVDHSDDAYSDESSVIVNKKESSSNSEMNDRSVFWRSVQVPENCFGVDFLVLKIEKSEDTVLLFWDNEKFGNLPIDKFIPPPTENQLDKYISRILEGLNYEDDEETRSLLKSYLRQPDSNWMNFILEEDKKKMREISDEPNWINVLKMIEEFKKSAGKITKLLIRYRALRLEDFISDSLPNSVGYISQKPNYLENPAQVYRLFFLFNLDNPLCKKSSHGSLYISIHPKIQKIYEQQEDGKIQEIDCWAPEIVCIKSRDYVNNLEWTPVARIRDVNDSDVLGSEVQDEPMEELNLADRLLMNQQTPEVQDESMFWLGRWEAGRPNSNWTTSFSS
ncbi:hypothetical protein FO519_004404 [Halicephalobus sp. NKZ332]|nr:hypothetical protein FO519_004404 [Halicephalobus sp. NKZ332]